MSINYPGCFDVMENSVGFILIKWLSRSQSSLTLLLAMITFSNI